MFWILCGAIAVLSALFVTLPLLLSTGGSEPAPQSAHDAEVYRDQLQELERDRAGGLISTQEAEYARAEIGRRLLAATDQVDAQMSGDQAAAPSRRIPVIFSLLIFVVVPLTGFALYNRLGMPDAPDQPLAMRLAHPNDDINVLIAKVEAQLAANPDDGNGWQVIAPIYMQVRRPDDAAIAWKNAARYLGPTPYRLGNWAEALVVSAQGEVSAEAARGFDAVLKLDPKDSRARFYLATRLEQTSQYAEAIAAFEALAKDSAPDAPWMPLVSDHITRSKQLLAKGDAAPGNPDAADVTAAEGMNAADRQAMIATMVEGLDARLTESPDNFEGWMRLVKSYMVLGKPDLARSALERGLKAFPASGDQGRQLIEAATSLGISTEGLAQ